MTVYLMEHAMACFYNYGVVDKGCNAAALSTVVQLLYREYIWNVVIIYMQE